MIKNGKMSSRKKNKHMKAKFFFIKDRVDDGEIKVFDCPAEEMWGDIMAKPLQGTAFRLMRAELMNCGVNYEDPPEEEEPIPVTSPKTVSWKNVISTTFKTPQECVGQNRNLNGIRRLDTRRDIHKIPERRLGVARLERGTWRVGVSRGRRGRE